MPQSDVLIEALRGSVEAPAGCGKTQLIVDAMAAIRNRRPVLILTHTNAGVAVLRRRLSLSKVDPKAFRVFTLDGWALRMVSMFPERSGVRRAALELRSPRDDYPDIRRAAVRLIIEGGIEELLRKTYVRAWVDEYQDCNQLQHQLVRGLSEALPTVVLGDPLQAIFGFGGNRLPSWRDVVLRDFPMVAQLDVPWRWKNSGAQELGEWLLGIRSPLSAGEGIELSAAPDAVQWVGLTGDPSHDTPVQLSAANRRLPGGGGTALILVDSKNKALQHDFARQTRGAVAVETVELREFIEFAESLDEVESGTEILELTASLAASVMTAVRPADLAARIESIVNGRSRKPTSEVESAALSLLADAAPGRIALLLAALQSQSGSHVFRPVLLNSCLQMARTCAESPLRSYGEVARRIREESRFGLRALPGRAVGSTLLLKGLEADISIVLDADPLGPEHLYVAMTRGAKRLVVCSRSKKLR